jgi:hypothetical protein
MKRQNASEAGKWTESYLGDVDSAESDEDKIKGSLAGPAGGCSSASA